MLVCYTSITYHSISKQNRMSRLPEINSCPSVEHKQCDQISRSGLVPAATQSLGRRSRSPTRSLSTMTLLHLLVSLLSLGTICYTDMLYFLLQTAVLMLRCDLLFLLLAAAVELQTSNMTPEVLRSETFTAGNCKLFFLLKVSLTCWFVWWKIYFQLSGSSFLYNLLKNRELIQEIAPCKITVELLLSSLQLADYVLYSCFKLLNSHYVSGTPPALNTLIAVQIASFFISLFDLTWF